MLTQFKSSSTEHMNNLREIFVVGIVIPSSHEQCIPHGWGHIKKLGLLNEGSMVVINILVHL